MSRRHTLNNLLLRKQLLVTEAELHRDQMRQDLRVIGESVGELGRKARSLGAVLSVVSLVAGGITALRGVRKKSTRNGSRRPGLFPRLFSGVRLASSLWRGWNSIHHSNHSKRE
jgi:hypothetical protein